MKPFREWYRERYFTEFPDAIPGERYEGFLVRQMERFADFMDYLASKPEQD